MSDDFFKLRFRFSKLTLQSAVWSGRAGLRRSRSLETVKAIRRIKKPSIAVFHQGGIGNGLLLGPMLQMLRSWKPESRVELFSWQPYEGQLLKAAGLIDEAHVIKRFEKTMPSKKYDLLLSAARTYEGDEAIKNISAGLKIGFRHRVGWHKKSSLYHDLTVSLSGRGHEVRDNASLLGPLIEALPPAPNELMPDGCPLLIPTAMHEPGIHIALHPGSEKITSWKRFSYEKMADSASQLRDEFNAKITVIAGPEELSEATQVAARIGKDAEIFKATNDLLDSFNLLRSVNCLATNDNSMMHLATAARCPVVAIFGPTDPLISGPWGNPDLFRVVRLPLNCSPCYVFYSGKLNCTNKNYLECLNGITEDQVFNAAKQLIHKKGSVI